VALTLLAAGMAALIGGVAVLSGRRRPRRGTDLPWGCGGARLDPRMQYTATSYAEPLVRVFDDALRPARDVQVTPIEESRYLTQATEFRQRVADQVEVTVYRPVVVALRRVGDVARSTQNGSIHRYLGYSFVALLVVLLAVTW
jgi:hydrogenase-4 component B